MSLPPQELANIEVGKPIARCQLWFCGIPYGASQLRFTELQQEAGFIETSAMTGMRMWRHKRWLTPKGQHTEITDTLTFQPLLATRLNRAIVDQLFTHRHSVLRRQFGTANQ